MLSSPLDGSSGANAETFCSVAAEFKAETEISVFAELFAETEKDMLLVRSPRMD